MGITLVEQFMGICDELAKGAAYVVEPCCHADVAAFAAKLCGMEGLDYDAMRERLKGVELPGDFRHLRMTNLSTGMSWGGIFHYEQRPLTLDQVLLHIHCSNRLGRATPCGKGGVWTETVALPIKDPGVLELGLRFQARN